MPKNEPTHPIIDCTGDPEHPATTTFGVFVSISALVDNTINTLAHGVLLEQRNGGFTIVKSFKKSSVGARSITKVDDEAR